jgi:hypothetical protein
MTAQERGSAISHIEDFSLCSDALRPTQARRGCCHHDRAGAGARDTGLHRWVQRLFTPYSPMNASAWRWRRPSRTSRHARRTQ